MKTITRFVSRNPWIYVVFAFIVLLTAWSMAGIVGPALVNYIREYQIAHGVAKAASYNTTMYIMAGLLIVGFICNALVRPLADEVVVAARPIAA